MRFPFCAFAILVMTLVACATPAAPTATLVPPTAPSAPAVAIQAPAPTQAAAASMASCATTNAAPPDKFRSDDPKKLEASAKPKLVEFYAVW